MAPRVLITGIGLITPLGLSTPTTWRALISGRSGIRHTPHHDALPISISAPVAKDGLPKPPPLLSPCPPFASFALIAAREALKDAQLLVADGENPVYDPETSGVSIGVGMAHLPEIANVHSHLLKNAYKKISPFLVPRILPNTPAGIVSLLHCLRGPTLAPATACAAGAHAVADGFHAIRRGEARVMVVGGAEAAIHPIAVAGFARAKALASSPTSAPFDINRSGFVLGEGAAILVLEEEAHARSRGVASYAELAACAATGDAFHITSPAPDGSGAFRAMKSVLRLADRQPKDVDYVNAHATGTTIGDAVERRAIARLLDMRQHKNPDAVVSGTKGATGHLLGAAGAVEAAFTVLSISEGVIPPTIGLTALESDAEAEDCGWGDLERYTPCHSLQKKVRFALSNSFGFGGTNSCLAFSEAPDGIPRRGIDSDDL